MIIIPLKARKKLQTGYTILELAESNKIHEIIQNYYPELNDEDIRASIQYAIALVASEDIQLAREPV